MKIAIVGYDREGRVSYEYYRALDASITVCDLNPKIEVPDGLQSQLGLNYLKNLDQFDLIIRTPGLKPRDILAENPTVADKIWTGTNEFLRVCPTKNIIGVTGTKGKGTTSTLISKMLQASGKKVHLGGNIGLPALKLLPNIKKGDWVVLELSSFQLIDIKYSPHIAVCLLVVPEHLDWHTDLNEYLDAKSNLFKHQHINDIAIYYSKSDNSKKIASVSDAPKLSYYDPPGAYVKNNEIIIDDKIICKTSEIKLLGEHNWQNICSAVTAVWQVTQDISAIKSVITTFSGLEHRLEFVKEVNKVKYYDDSFGTTPETAIVAIKAFDNPKVIILGGSNKGADYYELAKTIKNSNVCKVLLIGDQGPRIKQSLDSVGFSNYEYSGNTMAEIVNQAKNYTKPGDVVLLSTACASFDMFKDYKDRGEQFISAVKNLI
jgi:UDP-N-acetylmuramoylalanine--D-glutamate ligase